MTAKNELLQTNPQAYFHDKVNQACASLKFELNDHVEFYLVNLLCEFVQPPTVTIKSHDAELDVFEAPLVLIMKAAEESPASTRLHLYKKLGDVSLYVSGFFQDYFNRKTFGIDYYVTMGRNAYSNVSNLLRDHKGPRDLAVFDVLSENFTKFVDVMAEVSESSVEQKPKDILSVYDRWNRTKSERLRKVLERVGINPISTPIKLAQ